MAPSFRRHIVDSATVGHPPNIILGRVQTVKFTIYNFHKYEVTNDPVFSPTLRAHGLNWRIEFYPVGKVCTGAYENYISCYLQSYQHEEVNAAFSFRTKNIKSPTIHRKFTRKLEKYGIEKFVHVDEIDHLLDHNDFFTLEVNIQIAVAPKHKAVWYPKELQRHELLVDLYQDGTCSETSDVSFHVGEKIYHAHKNILALRCKKLYEISEECDSNEPIAIISTKEEIFKKLLDFAYSVKSPDIETKNEAVELLIAADCYDCVHLKLYAESVITDRFVTPETAAELILFADSYSCALLKEAAIDSFVSDPITVKKTKEWRNVTKSNRLLLELLDATTGSDKPENNDIDWLDVATIREQLEEADLFLDGSREVLVERLKTFRLNQEIKESERAEKNQTKETPSRHSAYG